MRTSIFTFLIFISLSVNGQTYYSFPTNNAKWIFNYTWYYFDRNPDVENYTIEVGGDTVIDVTTYHKLIISSFQSVSTGSPIEIRNEYKGAIREDLANKKVYFVDINSTTEELLYDFNLEVGDPVLGRLENIYNTPDVVESIDYVYVGNSYRKRWNINSCYRISIIEGVGSTYGLFNHSPGCVTDLEDYSLTCFKQDTDLYPNTLTECEFTTGLLTSKISLTNASVFPNPSKGTVKIDFNKSPTKEIQLTDLLGNVFLIKNTEGLDYIDIFGLKESIYVLTLTDNYNNKTMTKIVNCP